MKCLKKFENIKKIKEVFFFFTKSKDGKFIKKDSKKNHKK